MTTSSPRSHCMTGRQEYALPHIKVLEGTGFVKTLIPSSRELALQPDAESRNLEIEL